MGSVYSKRVHDLRNALTRLDVSGFLIPRTDRFQGEFVAPSDERLKYITGFSGSAGVAVVLLDRAVVMSDGRYTLQIKTETDPGIFETADSTKVSAGEWIAANAAHGAVIGYDPWLHSAAQIDALHKTLDGKGVVLKPLYTNPVDAVWQDRPDPQQGRVEIFPDAHAGMNAAGKREAVAAKLAESNLEGFILAAPDSIAWLLNIRGDDIPCMPVVLSHALIARDGRVTWFLDPDRMDEALAAYLGGGVHVVPPDNMDETLHALAARAKTANRAVGVDMAGTPEWFRECLKNSGAEVTAFADPCSRLRAVKTPAERHAIEKAHIADGVAIVRLLRWLETSENLTELDVGDKIEEFRQMNAAYRGASFPAIVGFAGNGAIIHYRSSDRTNARIMGDGLLLIDSGGQYLGPDFAGTTDITRTVAVGTPPPEMRAHYTLVLKGHIAIARARFPKGTTGAQIDALARAPLWNAGLDYAHGTGHGVGCYLGVHEAAPGISPRVREAPEAGMLLSNEPGIYKEGSHGIRLENLVFVTDSGTALDDGRALLEFNTVTLAPFDPRPIVPEMLEKAEREWLNAYHARVRSVIGPSLDPEEDIWLQKVTAPL